MSALVLKYQWGRISMEGVVATCRASAIALASCFKKSNKHLFPEVPLEKPVLVTTKRKILHTIKGYKTISRKSVSELGELNIAALYCDETGTTPSSDDLTNGGHFKIKVDQRGVYVEAN